MIRSRVRCCITFYRNLIIAIVVTVFIIIYIRNETCDKQILAEMSNKATKYISFESTKQSEMLNETDLQYFIATSNSQEIILNLDLYGPITNEMPIFVVYVRQLTPSLKYLIASLSELEGISDTLLIFSHSYFDGDVNRLIKSIDFCRTLQIFYPYSVQAHPNKFPGYDKEDCPRDMHVKTAENLNCTSAFFPDMHGRYRDPIESEKKLHWWWTANNVFENLSCTVEHKGIVVFIESNFFFMKDFIYVMRQMKIIAESVPQCDILSLGTNSVEKTYNTFHIEFTTWDPKYHSNVMAMDISTWNSIASHYDLFCLVDDYSWHGSLLHVSLSRKDGERFKVLSSVVPRALPTNTRMPFVEDINDSGLMKSVFQIMSFQKKYKNSWFPSFFEVYTNIEIDDDEFIILDYIENNGGWNDPRDKALCSDITISKIKKTILDMDLDI